MGFRGIGFSPMFSLLKPTFSLPLRPPPLARRLPSKAERSPTIPIKVSTASVICFSPGTFSAQGHSTRHLVPPKIISLIFVITDSLNHKRGK